MVYHFFSLLLETNQPHVFFHILPISVKFSNFWFSNRKREKTCCKQGNTSLETQYRSFLAISKPLPASRQTNILLPTGLEFQHLFMFKRVNKRKHAVSGKKGVWKLNIKFLSYIQALASKKTNIPPPSVTEIQHLQMGKRRGKICFET